MKGKVRLVMIGQCPNCHKEHTRPYPCDAAVCDCRNPDPILVDLQLALIMPDRLYKQYERIAMLAGVNVEDLVSTVLEVGCEERLKPLKINVKEIEICR